MALTIGEATAVCEDVLDGYEAECHKCGTAVHDGPCVEEEQQPS